MRSLLLVSCLAVAFVAACSGAKDTDLLAPVSGAAPSEPSSADAIEGSATGPATTSEAGSGNGSGTGAGTKPGTGSKPDAGIDAGGVVVDAGTAPIPDLPCGGNALLCSRATQVCCATLADPGKATFACKPAGPNACGGAVKISCKGASDCPAEQICCGLLSQSTGYGPIECRSACTSSAGVRAVHFCDPAAPLDECIGYGGTCIKSQSVPGAYVCG
jgi:hypothetical protein